MCKASVHDISFAKVIMVRMIMIMGCDQMCDGEGGQWAQPILEMERILRGFSPLPVSIQ